MVFKIKISEGNETIAKARGESITDFEDLFTNLKKKFSDGKKRHS